MPPVDRKRRTRRISGFDVDERPRGGPVATVSTLSEAVRGLIRQTYELKLEVREKQHELDVEHQALAGLLRDVSDVRDECRAMIARGRTRGNSEPLSPVWLQRLERLEKLLDRNLRSRQVSERRPAGKPQPGLDEVVDEVAESAVPAGEIVDIVKPGLLWRGSVLRMSQVIVADS